MKIATTEKLKFKKLQRRLGLPLWQATGLLETLWKATYRNAPEGDIGRLENEEIAAAIEWGGDADELIKALVETGWLDADPTHRLLVHDWEAECEQWLHANFKRHGKQFAKPTQVTAGSLPPEVTPQVTEQVTVQDTPQRLPLLPSPTIPPPPPSQQNAAGDWEGVEEVLFSHGVALAPKAVKAARDAGCNPMQVLNCIEFWRANQPKWKPGALYERITRLRPEQGFDQLWPDNVSESGARQVSADEFRRLFEAGRFSKKPEHHATKPEIVFGTLRTGERIECRSYPVTKKKKQEATA